MRPAGALPRDPAPGGRPGLDGEGSKSSYPRPRGSFLSREAEDTGESGQGSEGVQERISALGRGVGCIGPPKGRRARQRGEIMPSAGTLAKKW